MLLLNLTVENFGVFRGTHSFDLTPWSEDGQSRHLTVFSGHNGAGKTTLFQAMMIALYGSLTLSDKLNAHQYNSFLSSRMHRSPYETKDAPENSSVALSFQYVQSGRPLHIQVERRWQGQGRDFQEVLTILQNGSRLDIEATDYQTWLNDLISPGFGRLCFFDAEQLDTLANPDQQDSLLEETMERLLGLDLIERLQTDMDQYTFRQSGPLKIERLYTDVLDYRATVDQLDNQLAQLQREAEDIATDLLNCEAALAQQERLLATEGGAYAARRPLLQNRLQTVQKEIEATSGKLRELVGELLPFALVPERCLKLSERLIQEVEIRRQQTADVLWQEKLPGIEATLVKSEVWEELGISANSKAILTDRLMQALRAAETPDFTLKKPIIHYLTEPEHEKLQQWISQAVHDIPQQIQDLSKQLRRLREEQRRTETDLQRAPDDEVLAPIHAEIQRLRAVQFAEQRRQRILNEQIGSLQFQRNEQFRQLHQAIEKYEKAQKIEKQLVLAERTKLVLRTYRDVLTRQKTELLAVALVKCFNKICRKEHLLSKVHVDPEDFAVQLEDINGSTLNLNNFSAGERHLYALALLWALRLVSSRPLPLVVDTPLARLDEMHRKRFVHDYVPQVSDQVLLFTTDAELNGDLLAEVNPYVARIYRLKHDARHGETVSTWEDAATLQGMVPGALVEEQVNAYGI